MFASRPLDYYWSAEETEWATDVMFQSPEVLASVYPNLLRHGMTTFGSLDVLRFLGQPPIVNRTTTREVVSSFKTRPEGTRIKHSINRNSIKMYDKQQTVLRVETTINDPRDLKVFRAKEGDPTGKKNWLRLRKGVADLKRRAEISQKSNERYLQALASVSHNVPLGTAVSTICKPTEFKGRASEHCNHSAPKTDFYSTQWSAANSQSMDFAIATCVLCYLAMPRYRRQKQNARLPKSPDSSACSVDTD
ncbi:MAG: hypothetical protein U0941_26560 [Planctomycetaceae bacterium]